MRPIAVKKSLNSIAAVATVLLVLAACGGANTAQRSNQPSVDEVRKLRGTNEFLSDSAQLGNLVWTAGHLPVGVPPDAPFEDQVEQALDNVEATLEVAGAGFDTLVKANIYLLDWDDWETFNRIYVARIGPHGLPPRTTVQVAHIGLDYRIEIEMVAHVRPSSP